MKPLLQKLIFGCCLNAMETGVYLPVPEGAADINNLKSMDSTHKGCSSRLGKRSEISDYNICD